MDENYLTNGARFKHSLFLFFPAGMYGGTYIVTDHDFSLEDRGLMLQYKPLTFIEPRLLQSFMFIYW